MREVKAPLEPMKSRDLMRTKAEKKSNKFGKFVMTSGAIIGIVLVAKKLMTRLYSKKNQFKVYKVLKT